MSYDVSSINELGSLDEDKKLCDLLRFLITDQAFSADFIITTIFEYYLKNKPKGAL